MVKVLFKVVLGAQLLHQHPQRLLKQAPDLLVVVVLLVLHGDGQVEGRLLGTQPDFLDTRARFCRVLGVGLVPRARFFLNTGYYLLKLSDDSLTEDGRVVVLAQEVSILLDQVNQLK
mmetsp:Transcript_18974/g.32418  ORF Transcript_18974/g.32418 Transcript_18974/m.32418 type:complete len:117 (+) Transcript_18974:551-901(+)